jgi:hypothetical protein
LHGDKALSSWPAVPHLHYTYIAAADPSGGSKDSFTAAIAHNENGLAVLDCLIEIRPPFNPTEAVSQIAAMLRSYNLAEIIRP